MIGFPPRPRKRRRELPGSNNCSARPTCPTVSRDGNLFTRMISMNGHRPDYQKMLRDLRAEAERVNAAIRAVEALVTNEPPPFRSPERRGRKSMT